MDKIKNIIYIYFSSIPRVAELKEDCNNENLLMIFPFTFFSPSFLVIFPIFLFYLIISIKFEKIKNKKNLIHYSKLNGEGEREKRERERQGRRQRKERIQERRENCLSLTKKNQTEIEKIIKRIKKKKKMKKTMAATRTATNSDLPMLPFSFT